MRVSHRANGRSVAGTSEPSPRCTALAYASVTNGNSGKENVQSRGKNLKQVRGETGARQIVCHKQTRAAFAHADAGATRIFRT